MSTAELIESWCSSEIMHVKYTQWVKKNITICAVRHANYRLLPQH